jgi:hypothetical protein
MDVHVTKAGKNNTIFNNFNIGGNGRRKSEKLSAVKKHIFSMHSAVFVYLRIFKKVFHKESFLYYDALSRTHAILSLKLYHNNTKKSILQLKIPTTKIEFQERFFCGIQPKIFEDAFFCFSVDKE